METKTNDLIHVSFLMYVCTLTEPRIDRIVFCISLNNNQAPWFSNGAFYKYYDHNN